MLTQYAVNIPRPDIHRLLLNQGFAEEYEDCETLNPAERALYYLRQSLFQYNFEEVAESLRFTSLHLAVVLPSRFGPLSERILDADFRHVNQPDKQGMTSLHWASRIGDSRAVELLLRWGADAKLQDIRSMTALHHACRAPDAASAEVLLDAGCSPDTPDRRGKSALFWLKNTGRSIIDLLIAHGANLEHTDHCSCTTLHTASARGDTEIIDELLMHGANVNRENIEGYTPILHAVRYNHPMSIKALSISSELPNASAL